MRLEKIVIFPSQKSQLCINEIFVCVLWIYKYRFTIRDQNILNTLFYAPLQPHIIHIKKLAHNIIVANAKVCYFQLTYKYTIHMIIVVSSIYHIIY